MTGLWLGAYLPVKTNEIRYRCDKLADIFPTVLFKHAGDNFDTPCRTSLRKGFGSDTLIGSIIKQPYCMLVSICYL
jgi:hypothetical protein